MTAETIKVMAQAPTGEPVDVVTGEALVKQETAVRPADDPTQKALAANLAARLQEIEVEHCWHGIRNYPKLKTTSRWS